MTTTGEHRGFVVAGRVLPAPCGLDVTNFHRV